MPFFVSKKKIAAMAEKKMQAITEGSHRDVLSTSVTGTASGTGEIYENNYPTYSNQIFAINDMYNNRSTYGGEMCRSLIDTRVSFISGGSISVIAKTKKTEKWIDEFLKKNKLYGSSLMNNTKLGEMEGKTLLILSAKQSDGYVKVVPISWKNNSYEIETSEDLTEYTKVIVGKDNDNEKRYSQKQFVYIKLGGSPDRVNNTPPKTANILTDIENFSRAKYDLRWNNHLFAKVTPYFNTETIAEAQALNKSIGAGDFKPGTSYAGTANFSLVEPSGRAADCLIREMVEYARILSSNSGIPIHWLAYPDLMSNRATAENMLEAVNAATIQERTIWEESYTELIIKAMQYGIDHKIAGTVYDPDGFEIRLPLISLSMLKQIQETWIPLAEMDYISKATVRNKLPGINPLTEEKLIEKEKKEAIDNSPFLNMTERPGNEGNNDTAENTEE